MNCWLEMGREHGNDGDGVLQARRNRSEAVPGPEVGRHVVLQSMSGTCENTINCVLVLRPGPVYSTVSCLSHKFVPVSSRSFKNEKRFFF